MKVTAVRVFFLCFVSVCISCLAQAPPTIFWASEPVRPGEAALVSGADFGPGAKVELALLPADRPGMPGANAKLAVKPQAVETLQPSDTSVKFVIPQDMRAGVFLCWVANEAGKSKPILLNNPSPWWVQGDAGLTATPGGWIRIFGNCLAFPGARPQVVLKREERPIMASVAKASPYSIRVVIPENCPEGQYEVFVHNGLGGQIAWSKPLKITIAKKKPWPGAVFNVRDFGATGGGKTDDTGAINAALAKAEENGGGVVYFPRGKYIMTETLTVPRFTILRGERMNLAALMWPDRKDPLPAIVKGTNNFGIEDLTIYCTRYIHVIVADQTEPEAGNVHLRRVRVRADIFRGHMKVEEVGERFAQFKKLSTGGGDTIRLGGPNVEVTDCDLYGSGRSMYLYRVRGARIANNILYNGRWGWYCIDGSDGLILENNQILGADLMSTGGSLNCYRSAYSQNVYYANNILRNMHGWDREAMTTDAGYGAYWGTATNITPTGFDIVNPDEWKKWAKRKDGWTGAGVFIIGGKGAGQYRLVKSYDGKHVEVDKPWKIVPDEKSEITITMLQRNYLFVNNQFFDAGIAIQFYGTSVHHIVDGCKATRAGGFYNSGRWYRHYQPSWFCQFFNNEILEGNCYRYGANNARLAGDSFLGTQGLPRPPSTAPLAVCSIHRRNRLHNNAKIWIRGGNKADAPCVKDVIIENNTIENADVGIEIDAGCAGVLLRGNQFKNVTQKVRNTAALLKKVEEQRAKLVGMQGPIAHWTFDKKEGTLVRDVSGQGFHGVIDGEMTYEANGVKGSAAVFDGKGCVKVEDTELLKHNLFNLKQITLAAWIKPKTVDLRRGIIAKRMRNTAAPFVLAVRDGRLSFEACDVDGKWSYNFASKEPVIKPDEWQHVAAVVESAKGVVLYHNGKEVARIGATKEILPNSEPLVIGREAWGGAPGDTRVPGYFVGLLDEVKIWARCLSPEEVAAEAKAKP
ncbi:MAG: hypothetical protein GXP25_09155 [Planctomycetes bacterium]|nr:hypothetical protein [Planctomycetota bacterium]